MGTSHRRGKLIYVLSVSLLFADFLSFPGFSRVVLASEIDPSSNSNTVIETDNGNGEVFKETVFEYDSNNPDVDLLRKQQLQLKKLEELVMNLTQLVSRLESQFIEASLKVKQFPLSPSHDEIADAEKITEEDSPPLKENILPGQGVKEGRAGAVLVGKYNKFWSERFQFVSAVKLRSNPTCVEVLPYRDFEGLSKYFAVGDDKGWLYVFMRSGDVALELDSFLEAEESSSVTALLSYLSIYKNESMIVTGHENGAIVMHRVWEMLTGDELSLLQVKRVGRFEMPQSGGSRINILEVHYVGRKRYILAVDGSGNIIVFKENGEIHGATTPSRRPIAFLKQGLLFLTETGAGSLDLRTMKLKESECEGLNSSFAVSYVFDAMDRTKAYGFTAEGDLIHTLLLGDVVNFKCRVRSKRKLDMNEPLALQAIKGYLLIANREKVLVCNVSSQHYVRVGGLRLLFSAGLDEITASFLNQQVIGIEKRMAVPLITSDYEKHVIISLGNRYVAMYRSNLPVFKNEFNSIWWTGPVLFFFLLLFVVWHFLGKNKEALTSWGPDDPFSSASVTGGAPLGSGNGDRKFTDSSRNSEIMDVRGGGVRVSSRYVSPPQYSGGAASSYKPDPETDTRPAPVDSHFRPNSELKFRGSSTEAADVPKRRDMLFVNSQVEGDSK